MTEKFKRRVSLRERPGLRDSVGSFISMRLSISVIQVDHLTRHLATQKALLYLFSERHPGDSTAICPYCAVYLCFHTALSIVRACVQLCVCMQRNITCPALSASAWLRQGLNLELGWQAASPHTALSLKGGAHSHTWLLNVCAGPYGCTTNAIIQVTKPKPITMLACTFSSDMPTKGYTHNNRYKPSYPPAWFSRAGSLSMCYLTIPASPGV